MRSRMVAAIQLLLISPASLFMIALTLRHFQPSQYEPAHSAQQLVMWFAVRIWTLWVLLFGLPLIALVVGCSDLIRNWKPRVVPLLKAQKSLVMTPVHLISLLIALTTLTSGVILGIVVLHVLANGFLTSQVG